MPRKKHEAEEEAASEPDPQLEWSDEESSSDTPVEDSSIEVLKLLAQYGYEVKGKIIDGKLSYTFRSPKGNGGGAVPDNGLPPVPPLSLKEKELRQQPTYFEGDPAYAGPPPQYESGSSRSTERSSKKKPALRRKHVSWLLT